MSPRTTDRVVAGEALMPRKGAASGKANWAPPLRFAVTSEAGESRLAISSLRSMRPSFALLPGSVSWIVTVGVAMTSPLTISTPTKPKRASASMSLAARVSWPLADALRMKKASRASAPAISSPMSRPKSRSKVTMPLSSASASKLSSASPSARSKPKSMGVASETSSRVSDKP